MILETGVYKLSIRKMCAVIIVLLVFLGNYKGIVANNLATTLILAILPLMVIMVLSKKRIIILPGLCFYILLVIWTILSSLLFSEVIYSRKILAILLYSLVIIFAVLGGICFESFKKWYIYFAILTTVYIVVQAFFAYFFKLFLPAKILPIDLYEPAFFNTNQYFIKYGSIKLQSVFSEPAQYAVFIIPALCIALFDKSLGKTSNLKLAMLLSLGLVLSTSANGIVLMGFTWTFYLYNKNRSGFLKILKAIFFLAILFLVALQFEIIQSSLENLFIPTTALTSKADYRIYRGFSIFLQMPLFYKIFGVGVNNASDFINNYNIVTKYDVTWISVTEYFNNITTILIYSGAIGGLLFFIQLLVMHKNMINTGKIILICFVALCFSSSFYFTSTWIIYFLVMFYYYRKLSDT